MEFSELIAWALQLIYNHLASTDATAVEAVYGTHSFDGLWVTHLRHLPTVPQVCRDMEVFDDVHTAFNTLTYMLNVLWDTYVGGSGSYFPYDCW